MAQPQREDCNLSLPRTDDLRQASPQPGRDPRVRAVSFKGHKEWPLKRGSPVVLWDL